MHDSIYRKFKNDHICVVSSQDGDHPGPGARRGRKPEHTGLGASYRADSVRGKGQSRTHGICTVRILYFLYLYFLCVQYTLIINKPKIF